jgi:hypothetical protein
MEIFSFAPYRNRIKNLLVTSPKIVAAFAARDRQLLLQLSLPKHEALRRENKFFKVMHFHLPDGRTFLRVHNPDFYDDNLTLVRPMISFVNRVHEPTSGFEVGRYGPFFRVVEPIFHNGEYIGAFEFGIMAHQVLELLATKKDLTTTTYFDKDVFAKAFLFDTDRLRLLGNFQVITHDDNDIFQKLPADVKICTSSQRLNLNGHRYILHCRPIFKNFEQKETGGILVLQDITATLTGKKAYLIKSALFTTLMLIATLFVVYFYFGDVMDALLRGRTKENRKRPAHQ